MTRGDCRCQGLAQDAGYRGCLASRGLPPPPEGPSIPEEAPPAPRPTSSPSSEPPHSRCSVSLPRSAGLERQRMSHHHPRASGGSQATMCCGPPPSFSTRVQPRNARAKETPGPGPRCPRGWQLGTEPLAVRGWAETGHLAGGPQTGSKKVPQRAEWALLRPLSSSLEWPRDPPPWKSRAEAGRATGQDTICHPPVLPRPACSIPEAMSAGQGASDRQPALWEVRALVTRMGAGSSSWRPGWCLKGPVGLRAERATGVLPPPQASQPRRCSWGHTHPVPLNHPLEG